jgi:quaternary ammonium compound-resistance protein SugE
VLTCKGNADSIKKLIKKLGLITMSEESKKRERMNKAWLLLVVAGFFETAWAIGLKYTEGFTRLLPSVFTLVTLAISMLLLAKATKNLPIGTAYSVWVGIGALGAAIMGMILFKEPVTPTRIFFLILLLASIIGLKVTSA